MLDRKSIKQIFDAAFATGLQALRDEIQCVLDIGKDFAIFFLGGSYSNLGLYNKIVAMMAEFIALGSTRGIIIKYAFLGDREKYAYVMFFIYPHM